ncbi:adenine phosphoribosyltransferase 3-like [Olea europaea var. sylvestris]|uniref:adenine phosphoribosyltransferase 3-like n=1 Tax=Olea europaea var. sylvestris TaxID=158386 RepID=UPI000C1D6376|nr:adenine phosphoribosyltransferase 3-like [Olea europaea var. sylvestris]
MAAQIGDSTADRISRISSSIRVIPDFPKPGIMFQDITTLLLDPKAFKYTIDLFVERYTGQNISVVAGIEARGFIFGPPIALAIGAKFVPMRKPKKLPGIALCSYLCLFCPFL